MNRTPTNVMVNVMDFSPLIERATKQLQREPERFGIRLLDEESVRATIAHTWGFVETSEGIYVLCDEGVGNDKPTQKFDFEVHYQTYSDETGKDTGFSLFPVSSVSLTPDEVRSYASGETVELSEFIRTFGARLDNNFHTWAAALSPIASEVLS